MRDELQNEGEMMEMWVEVDEILETQQKLRHRIILIISTHIYEC